MLTFILKYTQLRKTLTHELYCSLEKPTQQYLLGNNTNEKYPENKYNKKF